MIPLLLGSLLFSAAVGATPTPRSWHVEATVLGGWSGIPSSLLDNWFSLHGSLAGPAGGLSLGWEKDGFHAVAGWQTLVVTMEPQVWLEKHHPTEDAKWVEEDLSLTSLSGTFAHDIRIWRGLALTPGIGWGPVWTRGSVQTWPTLGHSDTPLPERWKKPDSKAETVALPRRFLSGDLSLQVRYRSPRHFFLHLTGGWHTVLYLGAGVGGWL